MKDVNRYKTGADTKSAKPKVDLDYTKTRPKRLNKFDKNSKGMKVISDGWIEPEKIEQKPDPIRATTVKGRKAEIRFNAKVKQWNEERKNIRRGVL